MILREVFRYELAYRARSRSTWAYAVFLAALGFLITRAAADNIVHVNAPAKIAEVAAMFCGLFGMLVTAGLVGDAAVRDVDVGMEPLLYTTRLRKTDYLAGRFLGALAANAIVLVAIPLGMVLATLLPHQGPAEYGPFRLAAYVQPYLLFLLPNVVLVGAIMFTIAVLTRQTIPAYLGAAGLFAGYIAAANYWGSIGSPTVSTLADALGFNALREMTRYWTPAEQNVRLIGFPTMLLVNRALWLVVAATVLGVLHRRFRFAHVEASDRRRNRRREIVETTSERALPVAVPRVAGAFGVRTRVMQVLAVARRAIEEVIAGRAFRVTILVSVGLVLLWGWNSGLTVFDTSTWPVTFFVAEEVMGRRLTPFIWLVIAIYAGELVWKERQVGTAEIADAVPLPDGAALLGRFLALVAIIAAFHVTFVVGGILLQALQGYRHFELGLYVRTVLGLYLANYVLLGALAMAIHVMVNQKYLGHIVVLASFAFTMAAAQLGVRHHLLVYCTDPGWKYSDMNGFGPFVGSLVWFKLYWAAWALLLGVSASLLWVRGREPGFRNRLFSARLRFRGSLLRTAGVTAALIMALGGFVFYNTNILNEYRAPDERGTTEAEYEKRYKRFEAVPQPTIVAADLREEIYPDKPAVELRGTYRLVNRTERPIDSVHVTVSRPVQARSISVNRPARAVLDDEAIGYWILALERALAPGDSLEFEFDVAFEPHGFPNDQIQTNVASNSASFNRGWLPFIGYQPVFELTDTEARRHFGLAPAPGVEPNDSQAARHRRIRWDADLMRFSTIVGTAADQIVVTTGVLRRTWTEHGRRYFQYETEQPTAFGTTVYSGKYKVVEDRWRNIPLRIYHYPAHTYVLDRMVRGMKASLDYYTSRFGAYPYSDLRVVETPRYRSGGIAHPYGFAFAEDMFLNRVDEGEIDQPFFGTAHEVAHTWWGGQVSGADARGERFLNESLASYSAMMVTEKTYGVEVARRVYGFQLQHYLDGRAQRSREVPLLEAEEQAYVAYRKGAMAMYMLRERIGEEAVNTALRRYLKKYHEKGPPYPTSLDLYAELGAVTPDSLRTLLVDWFETVTLWDVKTERAVVERTQTGEYQVTLDVVAKKVRADSVGNETEVTMDDLVEIGVFGAPGKNDDLGPPLYLTRHRITTGKQTLRITVPREPARAGIDPYRKLIDRDGDDNIVAVDGFNGPRRSARVR